MKRLRKLNRFFGYVSLCGAPVAAVAVSAGACGEPFSNCEAHRSCPTGKSGAGGDGESPGEQGGTGGTAGTASSGGSNKGGSGNAAGTGTDAGGASSPGGAGGNSEAGAGGGQGQGDCAAGQKLCGAGNCVPEDGCCVESDCSGTCQTCSEGSCVAVQSADDPDSCAGTCDAKGICKSAQGQDCQTGDGCISGTTCAPDGVCCDTACTNSCEACDVKGFEGTCTPVASGKPHGNRPACEGDDATCAGSCTGREDGQCTFPTRACGAASTCSGSNVIGPSACAEGSCVAPKAAVCEGGFVCSGSACKTACTTDADCVADHFCQGGTCHVDAKQVAAGGDHTCVLLVDGTVRCWGSNGSGAIGLPTSTPTSPSPVAVSGLPTTVTAIAVGLSHTCALVGGNSIRCWGSNSSGQLGDGSETPSTTPVTVSGLSSSPTQISAGGAHTCARLADGTVWCWGANGNGQLGVATTTTKSSTPMRVASLSSMTYVAAGSNHTCAAKSDGTAWCWGSGSSAVVQVAYVTSASSLTASQAPNYRHTCALLSGGSIRCWGSNNNGQLGNGTTALSEDSVLVTGISTGATSVSAGGIFSCAGMSDGTALCWGSNGAGQLGNGGTAMDYPTPAAVTGLSTATQVAAGGLHACAVLTSGSVRCWGYNASGQLGRGNSTDSSIPVATLGW